MSAKGQSGHGAHSISSSARRDAERLGRFEIDDQYKLSRLHDWQFGRIFTLENPPGMNAGPESGHVRCN